jgi:hypothetical protein
MTLRGRLGALAVIVALLLAGSVVLLLASRTASCAVAAPRPSLAPALRALGDFDQAYDVSDVATLDDAAARAAGALHTDLIGATPQDAVAVAAARPGAPDAVVVPLRSSAPAAPGQAPLVGLVVFLRDCQGGAYFDTVEDDAALQPVLLQFPSVTSERAGAQLGSTALRLVYGVSPLRPEWVTDATPARSLPAR